MRFDSKFVAVALGCSLIGFTASAAAQAPPKAFDSSEAAAQALIDAAGQDDTAALAAIFGSGGTAVLTCGNAEQDKKERAEFVRLAHDKHQLEPNPMNSAVMILAIGSEDWPFPVPIVRNKEKWYFDTSQGAVEMRARRVGANELDAIEICAGYVQAQMDYATRVRDKHGMLEYAQRIAGPGSDSLYSEGRGQPLVPKAFAEAAVESGSGAAVRPKPYHGYYFRVLHSQGPDAPGGRHNYMVRDSMIGGFGLVAWPARYGVTGVHTFIVNQDGVIFEKDLGAKTAATAVPSYDPDKSWMRVE